MAKPAHEDAERRVLRLEEENRRLATELELMRETVSELRESLACRGQLLRLWSGARTDNEEWLRGEIARIASRRIG